MCFDLSLDEKLVKLFHQQTQSNFAMGLPSDKLRCNKMPVRSVKYLGSKN